jgi:hypothetical protein
VDASQQGLVLEVQPGFTSKKIILHYINYHAPGGFFCASAPAAVVTPHNVISLCGGSIIRKIDLRNDLSHILFQFQLQH